MSPLRVATFGLFLGEPPCLGFYICPLSARGPQNVQPGKKVKDVHTGGVSWLLEGGR